jgi:hemolysin activation/secretion protein
MNIPFPFPSGESRHANIFSTMGTAIAALLILVGLPASSYAQVAGQTITQVAFTMPTELESVLKDLHGGAQDLVGSPVASPKASAFAEKVSAHLRKNGYPFATARATSDPSSPGRLTVAVNPGKIGVGNVDGNAWLSSEGILKSILWTEGEIFHYGKFHSAAAALNRNRFVNVDSKLRPRRTESGEIIVDADFKVEDHVPLVFTSGIANDGVEQSSGWRVSAGFEWWQPFALNDKFAFDWLTDGEYLNSFSGQYSGSSGENWSWITFAGYSESEYDDLIAPVHFDLIGEGIHAGFLLSRNLSLFSNGSSAFNFGLTYLDLENRVSTTGWNIDKSLRFVVPRIGFQGMLGGSDALSGRSFWSISLLSDAGSANDADLLAQRAGTSSGFFAGQMAYTALQPLSFIKEDLSLFINASGQIASKPLPASLQKYMGGVNSVRGYQERESSGDHGVYVNAELRLRSSPDKKASKSFSIQPFFFYDFGFVKDHDDAPLSASDDSTTMHSIGSGVRANVVKHFNAGLHFGLPLKDTPDSKAQDPRVHFNLDFRF